MDNNIKVSVIMHIYNVEKYLEKCLESVINQTLKEIEINHLVDSSFTFEKSGFKNRFKSIQ